MGLVHSGLRRFYKQRTARPHPKLIEGLRAAIARKRPGVILVSAYLDHRPSVEAVAAIAREQSIPVLLGGPVFNHPRIAEAWDGIPGITHIFGGEADDDLVAICEAMLEGRAPDSPGIYRPGQAVEAPRLETLDELPVPDFSDFPWALYNARVLTVMTGRGCEWGRCTFCSDVVTANGRGFRTRPVDRVLEELTELSTAYGTKNTFFLGCGTESPRTINASFQAGNGSARSTWGSGATTAWTASASPRPGPRGWSASASAWRAAETP